jgi:hypothetical protein
LQPANGVVARGADEGPEQPALARSPTPHALRMPLHTDRVVRSVSLDRLDHSVPGPGDGSNPFPKSTVGLVVRAANAHPSGTHHPAEAAARGNVNPVSGHAVGPPAGMFLRLGNTACYVLDEPAAKRNAQHLRSAADTHHRQMTPQGGPCEPKLKLVARHIHSRDLGMRVLAVVPRVQVAAPGQQQSIKAVQ